MSLAELPPASRPRAIRSHVPAAARALASLTEPMIAALLDLRRGPLYSAGRPRYRSWQRRQTHQNDHVQQRHHNCAIEGLAWRGLVTVSNGCALATPFGDHCGFLLARAVAQCAYG